MSNRITRKSDTSITKSFKSSECHWTTLLYSDLQDIILNRAMEKSLSTEEIEEMKLLTKEINKILEDDKNNADLDYCTLKYKYIIDSVQILKLSKEDFPGKDNLFCEAVSCND